MSKNKKFSMNRTEALTRIDEELDEALAKLEETTGRIDDVLSAEGAPEGTEGDAAPKERTKPAENATGSSDDDPPKEAE